MADKPAFASTADHFAERAGKARDPDDQARLLEAASFYRSLARVANASSIDDPPYWRDRAQEMQRVAAGLPDGQDKQAILCIAKDYDRLAERAEQQAVAGRRLEEIHRRGVDFGRWRSLH
jgi:hypothetical protein